MTKIIRLRVEINEIEIRQQQQIQSISEKKSWVFEKTNKTDMLFDKLAERGWRRN